HDRPVPDARRREGVEHGGRRQADVRAAEVSAVPRARRDPEGSADREPRARPAHDGRSPAAGVDPPMAEEAVGHPARYAHAGVLARLPEVLLSATGRRRRATDSCDSRSPAHVPRWTDAAERWDEDCEQLKVG